jgi:hypothetical protein
MHNGARQMNDIHSAAGQCRDSSCDKSGDFFSNLPGSRPHRTIRGRRSTTGRAADGCADGLPIAARETFLRDYAHIDIHFRRGRGTGEVDRGCLVA